MKIITQRFYRDMMKTLSLYFLI